MINLMIAAGAAAVVATLVGLWLGPVASVVPALFVLPVLLFLLSRRTAAAVQAELQPLESLLQARRIGDAQALLESVRSRHARWQFMLSGQIDGQLGMMDYVQLKWDMALPKLEKGSWRNWTSLMCIGAIHYRKGDKTAAYTLFEKARRVGAKETMVYCVWSTLLLRDGKREDALAVVGRGLEKQPDSQLLKAVKNKIANKKKVDPKMFGDAWFQFFPEDMARTMVMRGRRDGQALPGQPEAPRVGIRRAPRK